MKSALVALALLFASFQSLPLTAQDLGGANLIVPIATRAAGAYGTQWRTDLVVTNLSGTATRVFISFYEGANSSFTDKVIAGYGTLVLEDVVGVTFNRDAGSGLLRVNAPSPGARLTARAYVYNRGRADGEYGQSVPAVAADLLSQEHVLSGISATTGRRTNAGVANPWPSEVDVILTLVAADGTTIAQDARTLAPLSVFQWNDVFASLGAPPAANASLRVHSSAGVYPYASIVRNDSGDAIFVAGTGVHVADIAEATLCAEPAALVLPHGSGQAADEAVVSLQSAAAKAYLLNVVVPAQGITITGWLEDTAFKAALTRQQIAALRCEGTAIKEIRLDGAWPSGE